MEKLALFFKKYWMIFAVVLYVVSPIDLIPDIFPILGQADDLIVVLASLLKMYFDYKKSQDNKDAKSNKETIIDGEIVEEAKK